MTLELEGKHHMLKMAHFDSAILWGTTQLAGQLVDYFYEEKIHKSKIANGVLLADYTIPMI